ncbi:MAG: CPBP family intramembrane glutamic endopeptidase [Phycisphaerales bacterium]
MIPTGLLARGLRARLAFEFVFLFAGAPVAVYLWIDAIVASGRRPAGVVFISLLSAVALSLALLLVDRSFNRRELWNWAGWRVHRRTIFARFIVLMGALGLLFALAEPDKLFELVRERPALWAMIMVFYPLWSVYPQELVYRTFIFHRYRALFVSERSMVWASALAFAWAHVILHNWLAVALCTIGGWLFAQTYARTRSLAGAWFEHALYGCAVFTLGMGTYFYAGAVGR